MNNNYCLIIINKQNYISKHYRLSYTLVTCTYAKTFHMIIILSDLLIANICGIIMGAYCLHIAKIVRQGSVFV